MGEGCGIYSVAMFHNAQIRTLFVVRNVFAVNEEIEPRSYDLGSILLSSILLIIMITFIAQSEILAMEHKTACV